MRSCRCSSRFKQAGGRLRDRLAKRRPAESDGEEEGSRRRRRRPLAQLASAQQGGEGRDEADEGDGERGGEAQQERGLLLRGLRLRRWRRQSRWLVFDIRVLLVAPAAAARRLRLCLLFSWHRAHRSPAVLPRRERRRRRCEEARAVMMMAASRFRRRRHRRRRACC